MKTAVRIAIGLLLAILFCAARLPAQTGALNGYCTLGAAKASTSGLPSSNYLQGVIPDCTVTVYLTGTTTKAALYSDQHNTPLTNPFTAVVTSGQWLFYASTASAYDIVMSGGITPNVYTVPVTLTSVGIPSPNSTINPIGPPYNCKIDGVTNDTACWQAVCAAAQLINGVVLMPAGTSLVTQQICTITQPMGFLGAGRGQSILSFVGSAPIQAAFDINNTSNVNIGDLSIVGTNSTTTGMLQGIRVRYSQHINLHDINFSNIGFAAGAQPKSNIYTENTYDVKETNIKLTGTALGYALVNGYLGSISVGLHQTGIIDENYLATNEITNFNCQFCDVQHSSVDQNNQPLGTIANGYGYLYYATNTTYALSSGCTGSGTLTCTIPLSGGITQLPVAPYFKAMIYGVTGGTGTLNSIFDAVLVSSTTFNVLGAGDSSGASYAAATLFFPTTNNLLSDIHGRNTAGSCIYLQGSFFTTVTGWECENVSQEQTGGSLPTGCVAVAGGNPNGIASQGDVIGPGTCDGSGQYGIDFADSLDLVITGVNINRAVRAGIRSFPGSSNNTNFKISSTIVDNSADCFTTASSGTSSGTVSLDCSNFTIAGIIPQMAGINFHDSKITTATYLPCVDDFFGANYDNVTCTGGFFLFGGSTPSVVNNSIIRNVIGPIRNHAVDILGAQHLTLSNLNISSAPDGIFFTNNGTRQPDDITIRDTRLDNIGAALIWDQAPIAVTVTTNTNTTVTITTATPVFVGMGLGDYGTGGNNDIPLGTTITAVTPPCNAGCTATISHAATGSHANEAGLLQTVMETGVKVWDTDAKCTPATVTQGFLFYGMQTLDLARNSISGCAGQGDIDLRGQTGQLGKVTVSGGTINQSTGLASVYLPGAILGSAANVVVQGVISTGTGTNDFYDHSIGTGNIINLLTGLTSQTPAVNVTNTSTTLKGQFTVSLTPGAVAASACAEQSFALSPGNGQIVQVGQIITVTPPGAMTHVSIGYGRGAASDHLVIQFCGDSTGGTPPAGTYTVSAL